MFFHGTRYLSGSSYLINVKRKLFLRSFCIAVLPLYDSLEGSASGFSCNQSTCATNVGLSSTEAHVMTALKLMS
jgi:hypothetical protein